MKFGIFFLFCSILVSLTQSRPVPQLNGSGVSGGKVKGVSGGKVE